LRESSEISLLADSLSVIQPSDALRIKGLQLVDRAELTRRITDFCYFMMPKLEILEPEKNGSSC
jgi:hypothetical protein